MSAASDRKASVRAHLQPWPAATLRAVASGQVDAQQLAREEMINRGLGLKEEWVGFEKARMLWEADKASRVSLTPRPPG